MKFTASVWDTPAFRQTVLAMSTAMSFFCIGLVRGYSAPAVPSVKKHDLYVLPTHDIQSWASSVPPSGAFFGSIVAGFLLQRIGRKHTITISSPIATLGWILISSAKQPEYFIIGRFLSGFSVGLCLPSAQIYISESCDPQIRGVLGSLPSIMMSFGILVAYIIGTFVKWNILGWICCSCAAGLTLIMSFLPESPVWLRGRGRYQEADISSAWLKLEVNKVIVPLSTASQAIATIEKSNSIKMEEIQLRKVLFTRPILLPLTIGLTLLVLQQISGIDAIIFFTVEIFTASGSDIDEHLATIIVGLVQLICNISSLFIVDRAGRKPLLLASAIIMCLSMASMGIAFYLKSLDIKGYGFLPLTSLIVYMVGFSIGFGCIPFLLMGELFPTEHRSMLSSIAGSFNLGVMFIVIKTYHILERLISTAGTFWMYSFFCGLAIIFVVFIVPETKGRDLENIQKLFANKSIDKINGKSVGSTTVDSAIQEKIQCNNVEITRL